MSIKTGGKRLRDDYVRLQHNIPQHIRAHPLESDIFKWHYVLIRPQSAENSAYSGGIYHGIIVFPLEFPHCEPDIMMLTPNGRFYRESPICMAIQWSPVWTVGGLLEALFNFMLLESDGLGAISSHRVSKKKRKKLAKESWEFNLNDRDFCELFPELAKEARLVVFRAQQENEFVIKRLAKQTYSKAAKLLRVPFNARKLSRMM